MTDPDYTLLKKTQVHLLKSPPFYIKNEDNSFVLYKEAGEEMQNERLLENEYPDLYISAQDKDAALKELADALNYDLVRCIADKGLPEIKQALCRIVEEAIAPEQTTMLDSMPDTLGILIKEFGKDIASLKMLGQVQGHSDWLVEHTVNVAALTLQYCFFHQLEQDKIQQLFFCALLHDIGAGKIDPSLLNKNKKLTDKQFQAYQEHTTKGHDLIIIDTHLDVSVAEVALEHHERIDGSGYPNGTRRITPDSQLISIIDCFEPLTFRNTGFREHKTAYDSLSVIKAEVQQGRFDKVLFKHFVSCLVR